MAALVAALERHVNSDAANNRRAPVALGDADELRSLVSEAGFINVKVCTLTETARFPTPETLIEAQLAATPLSTLGALSDEVRQRVSLDVRAALNDYLENDALEVPMEAHIVVACK